MKKGKIIGKKHIVLGVLVIALSAAVWLNMRYASADISTNDTSSNKNLGDSIYVDANAAASNAPGTEDYFQATRTERAKSRKEAIDLMEETINNVKTDDDTRKSAVEAKTKIAMRIEKEASVEALIKAKGFADAVAVISDDGVSVVVKAEELLGSETLQIQDIIVSQTKEKLENIKIVTVK